MTDIHFDYATSEYDKCEQRVASLLKKGDDFIPVLQRETLEAYQELLNKELNGSIAMSQRHHEEVVLRGKRMMSVWVAYQRHRNGWQGWLDYATSTPLLSWVRALYRNTSYVQLNMSLLWHMSNWLAEGRRMFFASESLCRRLQNVEVRGFPADAITLPFRSFCVRFPPGVGWSMPDPNGDCFDLHTAYVTDDPAGAAAEINVPDPSQIPRTRRIEVFIVGQWREIKQDYGRWGRVRIWDDQMFHWSMPVGQIETLTRETASGIDPVLLLGNDATFEQARRLTDLSRWLTWLFVYLSDSKIRLENGFLYESTRKAWDKANRHPKSSTKHKRAVEEARKLNQQQVIRIGGDVAYDPSIPISTGRKLEVRQYVRSHRKRVPVGPGGMDRKEVAIAAYWRGPEDGEETHSDYLLR